MRYTFAAIWAANMTDGCPKELRRHADFQIDMHLYQRGFKVDCRILATHLAILFHPNLDA
jgi:hypothetical protein